MSHLGEDACEQPLDRPAGLLRGLPGPTRCVRVLSVLERGAGRIEDDDHLPDLAADLEGLADLTVGGVEGLPGAPVRFLGRRQRVRGIERELEDDREQRVSGSAP